jgi:hypothetical protein
MKRILRTVLPVAAIILFGFNVAQAIPPGDLFAAAVSSPGDQDGRPGEAAAARTLASLGVPLQQDSQGVVRWIEATKGELTDEAVALLPRLSRLEWLEIGGGKVSPAGIAHLKGCTSLKRLYIHDINLGDSDLAWLSNLHLLEALSLQHTGISGKVLKNIAADSSLTVLNLSGDKIGDDDMPQIARLQNLEVLALADTRITGTGIAKLEGMKKLNELNIMRCDVLDSDLDHFLYMPNLRIVYAEGCSFSEMAVQMTVTRFPLLAIFR